MFHTQTHVPYPASQVPASQPDPARPSQTQPATSQTQPANPPATTHQPPTHQVRGSVSLGTFDEKRGGADVIPVKLPNLVFCGVFVTPAKRRNLRAFRQKRVKFAKKPRVFPSPANGGARFYSRKTVLFSNGPRKIREKVATFRTLYIPILHFAVQKLTFSTAGRSLGR